SANPTKAYRKA
ncbi:tonB family C-terminal domain-containing protein, partial [Helicobacter pylori]